MKNGLIITLLVLFLGGCDAAKTTPRTPSPAAPTSPPVVVEQPKPEPAPAEEKKPETVLVKAEAGVTGKGQYNDGGGEKATDILTVPMSQYFRVQERITFDVQLKHTEDLYKASHDNKLPATNEEYMKEIIQEGQIKLPPLPEGHKYVFVPEQQQLMVEKPK